MFGANLKRIMSEKNFTVTKLSQVSGVGKSSISQYLSGKNVPSADRIHVLADSLGCTIEELAAIPVGEKVIRKTPSGNSSEVFNVPVEMAAKLMHKKNNFVYEGLQQGVFPWGYAVKTSSQWSYFISSVKFTEHTGIPVSMEA